MKSLPLRPAAALLSRSALTHNLNIIRAQIRRRAVLHRPGSRILAIVKADAYGHDLQAVLPELEKHGVDHFAVASLYEAISAREISKRSQILVLGGTFEWHEEAIQIARRYRLEVAINSLATLKTFRRYPEVPLHLKLDTGMNRLGIKSEDWADVVAFVKKNRIKLAGLFTHFASPEEKIFRSQAVLFQEAVRWLWAEGIQPKFVHSENSEALFSPMRFPKGILSEVGNLVRPGLAMYGYLSKKNRLRPVLELHSAIGQVKVAEVGEGISYDHLYRAPRAHAYGIVPVGYADGLSKEYVGGLRPAWFDRHGKRKGTLRICGAICMDMVMVKPHQSAPGAKIEAGDRISFWGDFPNSLLHKKIVGPYELNLRIAKRIPRIWIP